MSSPSTGLLLLAGTIVIMLIGLWDVLAAAAARDELRERASGEPPPSRLLALWVGAVGGFERIPPGHRLQMYLEGAAVPVRALPAMLIAIGSSAAAYFVVSLLLGKIASITAALLVLGALSIWLERKRDARRDAFLNQLPELAQILSNGASAGLSMVSAFENAVEELDDPAQTELQIASEEIRIGQPFERAMEGLGERMPSRELGVLVSTLAIQQRSGGDLVRALSDMSSTLDARKDTLREVKTLMAGAVASAYFVIGIGAASVFLADLTRPGTLDKVAGNPLGLLALAVAGMLFAVGYVLVRRITRIAP